MSCTCTPCKYIYFFLCQINVVIIRKKKLSFYVLNRQQDIVVMNNDNFVLIINIMWMEFNCVNHPLRCLVYYP